MGQGGRGQLRKVQETGWRRGQHVDRVSEWNELLQEMLGQVGEVGVGRRKGPLGQRGKECWGIPGGLFGCAWPSYMVESFKHQAGE